MFRCFRICALTCLAIVMAGCAVPVTESPSPSHSDLQSEIRVETGDILEKYMAAEQRLLTIGGPLLMRNADFCPRRGYSPGFTVHSDFDVPQDLQHVAYERLLLGHDATVQAIIPGSAAQEAGILPGDILLSMDGKPVRNAAEARARVRHIRNEQVLTFGFMRNGQSREVKLPFKRICAYALQYQGGNREINAFASGKSIVVTQGMMDFTNDAQLEIVLGHELAHNIMHHIPKDEINTSGIVLVGGVIDSVIGLLGADFSATEAMMNAYTRVWSSRFEKEADYVGLYLVARAGGDIGAAPGFWRRMAAEHGMDSVVLPAYILHTHPDTPDRFVALEATEKEINAKLKKHEPLAPNLRDSWNFGARYMWWENDDENEPSDEDLNH